MYRNGTNYVFTVENGKKRFTLCVGCPIFSNRQLSPASIDRGLRNEHVAEEMRLHGEAGYHWTPSHSNMIQRGGI